MVTQSSPVKSLTCFGGEFILSWETALSKLMARIVTPSPCRPSADRRAATFCLGHEVEIGLTFFLPFEVLQIQLSPDNRHLLCTGLEGAFIVALPSDLECTLTDKSRTIVQCSSKVVDSELFTSSVNCAITDALWVFPSSLSSEVNDPSLPSDSSFCLLMSNNTIRLYNSTHCSKPKLIIRDFTNQHDILDPLVSIAAFTYPAQSEEDTVNIFCLTSGGDAFIVTDLRPTNSKHNIKGPLKFLPASDDNYGDNFVKCFSLSTDPVAFSLVRENGDIMHGLLLDDYTKLRSGPDFHVVEQIPFAQNSSDANVDSTDLPSYSQTFVYGCDGPGLSYFICNTSGVYLVTADCFLPFTQSDRFDEEATTESTSSVRQLLSCNVTASTCDPLIGFVHLAKHGTVFCTCASLTTYLIPLKGPTDEYSDVSSSSLHSASSSIPGLGQSTQPFLPFIQKLIKHTCKPPKISLAQGGDSEELSSILARSVTSLREHRVSVLRTINDHIGRREQFLGQQLANQSSEVTRLKQTQAQLIDKARHIANKLESLHSDQEVLEARCDNINRLINSRIKVVTDEEKRLVADLNKIVKHLDQKNEVINSLSAHFGSLSDVGCQADDSVTSLRSLGGAAGATRSNFRAGLMHKMVVQESHLINDLVSQVNSLKVGVASP